MVSARKARKIAITDAAGGLEVQLTYRNSRSTVIRVSQSGAVRMGVPYGMPDAAIEDLLRLKLPWIRSSIAKAEAMGKQLAPLAESNGIPSSIQLLGGTFRVRAIKSEMQGCRLDGGALEVSVKDPSDGESVVRQIGLWYRAHALKLASGYFESYWPKFEAMGHEKPALRIRAMRTRWGSYSRRTNSISLNVSLIKAPAEFMEYVVAHELAHLMHLDHSPFFRDALSSLMPDWKARRRDLRAWATGCESGRNS